MDEKLKDETMGSYILEVEVNAEGSRLAYLSPADEDGNTRCGYRIAGPKAWGGSKNIARLKISSTDLAYFIKKYAPDVLEELVKPSNEQQNNKE